MRTALPDTVGHEVTLEFTRTRRAEDRYDFHGLKPQEYMLRMGRGGVKSALFPWSERVQEDLAALARLEPDPVAARRLGEDLRSFLDALDWGGHERPLEEAARQGRALRLVLRSAAAELYSLPWELTTLKDSGQHLADVPGFSLRYEWPSELPPVERTGAGPEGRVLLVSSNKGGGVPDGRHEEALLNASMQSGFGFDPRRDVLRGVSLERLEKTLQAAREARQPVTVLHVLCHGAPLMGSAAGHHGLAWNTPGDGTSMQVVDGVALGAALAPYADTLRMVVLCACHGGDGGRMASHLGSVAQELHRVGRIEMVVASRLPLTKNGSILLTQTLYEKLLVDSSSLEEALGAARSRLRRESMSFDWASLQLYARRDGDADLRPVVLRPYRGLLPFGPADRHYFFGRSRLVAELLERARAAARGERPRFQVVAGASGAGKSSVVMAGLIPQLSSTEWDWLKVKPGELARAMPGVEGARPDVLLSLRAQLHRMWTQEPLVAGGETRLADVVEEARKLRQQRPEHTLLLVVDQLEEIFTQLGAKERQSLMEVVWALAKEPELGCVVVATMRVDYFERCGEVVLDGSTRLDAVVYAEAHRLFVARLVQEELKEAIEKPAHRVGLVLEEGLVDRLCRDVGQEPGALPLLEHALDQLWHRREGNRLTYKAYEQMEGVAGGLKQTAEQLHDELTVEERRQVERLLVELVALGETMPDGETTPDRETTPDSRRRGWLQEIQPSEATARAAFESVLERLVEKRLVIRGREKEEPRRVWLEVAHEALIRRWERMRGWLEKNRKQLLQWRELQAMADAWQEHRKDPDGGSSYLATGARLGYARSILDEHEGPPTASVRQFLEACEARAQHRLREVLSLTTQLHTTVGTLKDIGGTVTIRNELLTLAERVLVELDSANEPEPLHMKAVNHVSRGDTAMTHANTAIAQDEYSQALTLVRRLLASHPDETAYQGTLATIHLGLGRIAQNQGRFEEADHHQRLHHETLRQLLRAEPTDVSLKQKLATSAKRLGEVAQAQGKLEEARQHYESAFGLEQELRMAGVTDTSLKKNLAVSHNKLGDLARRQGKLVEAQGHYEHFHALVLELSAADPTNISLKRNLAISHLSLGRLLHVHTRLTEARRHYQSAHELFRELSLADPTNATLKQDLSAIHHNLGELAQQEGQWDDAHRHHEHAYQLSVRLLQDDPANTNRKQNLAMSHGKLGDLAMARGQLEDARRHYTNSHELYLELSKADPANAVRKQNLAVSHDKLGDLATAQGQSEEARRHHTSAHELRRGAPDEWIPLADYRSRILLMVSEKDMPVEPTDEWYLQKLREFNSGIEVGFRHFRSSPSGLRE